MWDAITNPCLRYLLLAPKSSYMQLLDLLPWCWPWIYSIPHGICIQNWPNSQSPKWTCSISHNAPFKTEMCIFLFWREHYAICNRCILVFVKLFCCTSLCFGYPLFVDLCIWVENLSTVETLSESMKAKGKTIAFMLFVAYLLKPLVYSSVSKI